MPKESLLQSIGGFLEGRLKLQKKGKYWLNDNGIAKLLFHVEAARFMDGFFINVGLYYNTFPDANPKATPKFLDWHFNADIGYVYQGTPVLVGYDISEPDLNAILDKVESVVMPYVESYRSKDFLKTHPDIWQSPWQKRIPKDEFFAFADSL